MILEKTLVVFDLESTGTWIEKDKIIEVGMIKRHPDGTEEEYCKRINPGIVIPKVVTELTGISDDDVRDCPLFDEVALEILAFIGDADLAGFNLLRFDIPLLNKELESSGNVLNTDDRFVYDAQKIYHIHERRDLTAAYQFFCDKELDGAHSALVDSRATLDILKAQVAKYGKDQEVESLKEFDYAKSQEFFNNDRKFRWWNGDLYITFGKHSGKKIGAVADEDRGYLEWMLNKDFSDQVKAMLKEVLGGTIPRIQ